MSFVTVMRLKIKVWQNQMNSDEDVQRRIKHVMIRNKHVMIMFKWSNVIVELNHVMRNFACVLT
jgi:hypothetical protein